ncbi:hypothetical protein TNCV_2097171, partial [Trichonephila clavipes]
PTTAYNAYNRLTACNRLQPPATAYNRLQPPATAYNRLQPPAPPAPPLQQNRLFLPTCGLPTNTRSFGRQHSPCYCRYTATNVEKSHRKLDVKIGLHPSQPWQSYARNDI